MKRMIALSAFVTMCLIATARDNDQSVSSALKTVTVYRSGAQLVHTAFATLRQGNNTLIIENVSNQVDVNSIQVKAPATVTIMGVEFSGNYLQPVEQSQREKMLLDSIDKIQQDEEKLDLSITNTTDLLSVLKDNRNIKGEQNGLSVAELIKLMDYYKAKSLELQTDLQQLKNKKKKLGELITKLQNQVSEEQKKNTTTAGRLTLQLSAAMEGRCEFTISYIAQNAYWTPTYDVRADNINSPLKLVYKAKVVQTTGIDWKQVKLSLATAMPSQCGNAPQLNTWFVGYVNPVVAMENTFEKRKELTGAVAGITLKDMSGSPGAGATIRLRGVSSLKSGQPLTVVNGVIMNSDDVAKINPNDVKTTEILNGNAATSLYGAQAANGVILVTLKDGLNDYVSVANNALDVTFDIDMPYDVPTNGKEQTATLQVLNMPATYKHFSIPKLDKDAYLLADIPGWEKFNLLPGDANIIVDNTYIGKSFIDPSSTSDTMHLTLGRDQRITIKREKVADYSSVKFLGSNKLQKFTYEITVKNNKSETIDATLKDQFPVSTDKDIEVTLIDSGNAEVNNETGILNWRLSLAPNETKKLRFVYSIRYAKDKNVNLN